MFDQAKKNNYFHTIYTRLDTLLLRHRWLLLAFPYHCVAADMDEAISWTQPCLWSVYIEESCIALQIFNYYIYIYL